MKVVLFGAGNAINEVILNLKKKIEVIGIIDNDTKKIGKYKNNIKIYSASSIKNLQFDYVIISSIYYESIKNQLKQLNVDEKRIILYYERYDIVIKKDIYKRIFKNYSWYKYIWKYILLKSKNEDGKIYELYLMYKDRSYLTTKRLREKISENSNFIKGKCLDLGCGSKPYENLFDTKEYIGVDIEESGHVHFDSKIDVFYDGVNLPFEDEEFDSIFSSQVFEHIFNQEKILCEMKRVLKIGGFCVITIPFVWPEHEEPYDNNRYTKYGLEQLFIRGGFEVIKIEPHLNYFETIVQLWCDYMERHKPKRLLKRTFRVMTIFIPNMLCSIFKKYIPKDYVFYDNNIIVVKKVKEA